MLEDSDLNAIVYNIISENRYSNCRLCLNILHEHYVRFDDLVSLNPEGDNFQPLATILTKLLGENICDEITGIDAVCPDCVAHVLSSVRFMEKCQKSDYLINQVFENLTQTLSVDINTKDKNKALYLLIENLESKALLVKKNKEKQNIDNVKHLHKCHVCLEYFDTVQEFTAHNLTLHDTYTCEICLETFENDFELINHGSTYHRYKCPECPQYRSTVVGLKNHENMMHSTYTCKECGKTCQGLHKLQIHEDKHKVKSVCPKCGKTYTTREFYEKHVELCLKDLIDPHPIRSTMEKAFTCEKCDKAYSTPGGLRVHERFAHGNAKPHICKECGKMFTAPSYLKVHMVKHTGEKNFKCEICTNRFVSKEALLYHTRRHTGEKPYSCKICNEKFVNASARAEHIKFKHVGPTLMCEICSRKFVTTHFLKQHISRHHDPTSKLYYGRNMIPPNLPVEQNMRRFIIEP
ncbi:gastrula zinc finger protein XlCGF46.1 [Bicyclus anynana]|uniref:Gastrula zinc finger protein XlCGF46.1 n=1 Tax=Bicyclus anynana TaxID=110368 RepID=A0A6J1P2P3_BICAN|nr:gastrula zinc finger protein XlCGF46.1 [Bicyclus anynana]